MSNPTIFLDIDGVLNSMEYAFLRMDKYQSSKIWGIDPYAIERFQYIFEKLPITEIVISSTWRKHYSLDELKEVFTEAGFKYSDKIVGYTPSLFHDYNKFRGHEIKQYIQEHNIDNYVIIDDSNDMLPSQRDRMVLTHNASGITFDDVIEIIGILDPCNSFYVKNKSTCRGRLPIVMMNEMEGGYSYTE